MRNVMVRCIFSALSVGVCIVAVLGQEIHRYQWSDQQVLADEWKPFVPGFTQQRQFETYPQRPDSSRQFFGKAGVEPIQQNLYKKSFQTAASSNNIEPYAVPPILGSFNTFGLQTIQARNPLLEKNIKDNQFLDQGSHLQPKYYPQNSQQPQRFPSAFGPPQPQYVPQQQHYPNQYRLESQVKQQQPLLQSPSRTIQTSVQVFPPNPPTHYQPNTYFLGVPPQQKQENYEDDSLTRKQTLHRPANDFLLNNNNIVTIYGSRDPSLSIPPPTLKPAPFVRNEQQDHYLYENPNLKPVQRYETPNVYKRPYEPQPVKHIDPNGKPKDDNPSKQVYEQLSQFGRPFSLPKESVTEYTRIKPEQNPELETIQGYGIPAEHYKKEKIKPSQLHSQYKTSHGRVPVSSAFTEVSTATNLLLDYEPGKLQSVKTVTYTPQRDVLQFNEEDVPGGVKQYQNNEKFNSFTRTPFLPTPTETEDEGYDNFQRITTPPQKLTSSLPKNHKYGGIQHATRNRYPPNYQNQEPSKYRTSTESQHNAFEEKSKYSTSTQTPEYDEAQYETTTRKSSGRRRKPSKNKTKDQTRHKSPSYADASTTSTVNNDNYYGSNDVSTTEAPVQHTTKKKQSKITTLRQEDDYPNYPQYVKQENYPEPPNYPQYVKQSDNYPKEYFQSTLQQSTYKNADTGDEYYNSGKEEKENYPQTPQIAISTTTTTTTAEPTTASMKARIKNKYGNSTRPRFSIKDYKRTTTASTQSTPSSTTELPDETVDTEKKNVRKFTFASRVKNKTETAKPAEESTSESLRKYSYKPRTRPSKYRSTSTTVAPDTTTERVYTFKPSTSRYKTSTSKYYNRFRTTTEVTSNDAEEPSVASSDKKPVRTMLFSAKRSSLLKSKSTTTPKAEEIDDEEETDDEPSPTLKKTTQYTASTKLDKADDASQTNIMTSSEEQNEKKEIKEAAKKTEDTKETLDGTASSEEVIDDFSDILDMKENEVTTPSNLSAVADDRMDDADKVSKVSSLTSIDESDLPMSFFQKWTSKDNQNQ